MTNTNLNIWRNCVNLFLEGIENTVIGNEVAMQYMILNQIEEYFDDVLYELDRNDKTSDYVTNNLELIENAINHLLIEAIIYCSNAIDNSQRDTRLYTFYKSICKQPFETLNLDQLKLLHSELYAYKFMLEDESDKIDIVGESGAIHAVNMRKYSKYELQIDCVRTLQTIVYMYKQFIQKFINPND